MYRAVSLRKSLLTPISGTLGFVFLIVIMFTLGDLETILASATGQPLPQIFLEATGSTGAAFGLFFMSTFHSLRGIPVLQLTSSPRDRSFVWIGLFSSCFPMCLGVSTLAISDN